jgi:hypothetical protein
MKFHTETLDYFGLLKEFQLVSRLSTKSVDNLWTWMLMKT